MKGVVPETISWSFSKTATALIQPKTRFNPLQSQRILNDKSAQGKTLQELRQLPYTSYLKNQVTLDPVGATVCYEMIKL